jgi:hypothetical protein
VSAFLEFKCRVGRHFLAVSLSESLGPLHFSRISLQLKISVAFGSAKAESLAIISDESDTMAGIDVT